MINAVLTYCSYVIIKMSANMVAKRQAKNYVFDDMNFIERMVGEQRKYADRVNVRHGRFLVAQTSGVFDNMYKPSPIDVAFLETAKRYSEFLIATVTSDEQIEHDGGAPARKNAKQRALEVASLGIVDVVSITPFDPDNGIAASFTAIQGTQPDMIFYEGQNGFNNGQDLLPHLEQAEHEFGTRFCLVSDNMRYGKDNRARRELQDITDGGRPHPAAMAGGMKVA